MTNKDLLEAMAPAIENIDMGCPVCIREFTEVVNPAIESTGLQFVFDREEGRVTVEQAE